MGQGIILVFTQDIQGGLVLVNPTDTHAIQKSQVAHVHVFPLSTLSPSFTPNALKAKV